MTKIVSVHALEILDSRGTPTLKALLRAENGVYGTASVPSGASTGEHEALELRDHDPRRYFGKGVLKAVSNVNGPLNQRVQGMELSDQEALDRALIEEDGTPHKS